MNGDTAPEAGGLEDLQHLPEGYTEHDFGGLDLLYEHLLAREVEQEETFSTQVTAAGFVVATSGVLIGLLTRQQPAFLYAAAGLVAFLALGTGVWVRYPGRWTIKGPANEGWESADAVQLKRALVAEARRRTATNATRLKQTGDLLKWAYWLLLGATLLAATQVVIDFITSTL